MNRFWQVISIIPIVLLTSCASEQVYRTSGSIEEEQVLETDTSQQVMTTVSTLAEEEQQALAEKEAAEAAEREAVKREEEQAETRRQQLLAVQQREEEQQRQAEQAEAQQRSVARAEAQARQQAEVDALRARISANESEAVTIDAANSTLREAIVVAESLSSALSQEQQKYSQTDPATGKTLDELASSTLDELNEEIEQLRAQAQALQSLAE